LALSALGLVVVVAVGLVIYRRKLIHHTLTWTNANR
jgi:hypothetical protein